MPTNYLT